MNEKNKATLAMVVCALMWSISGILIKMISWNPLVIASVRSMISTLVLLIIMKKSGYRVKPSRTALILGGSNAFGMLTFISANKMTTAANAIVLQYTCPVWVLFIAVIFLKERAKKYDVAAVVLCLAGMTLFFLDKITPGNVAGNILAILAGVAMGIMFTASAKAKDLEERFNGLFFGQFITAIAGLAGFAVEPFHAEPREVLFILILGIIQLGLPYALYAYASSHISALACSLIGMLEPMANPVWVAIFYGEVPGRFALIGAVVIIVTTSLWCVRQSREGQL